MMWQRDTRRTIKWLCSVMLVAALGLWYVVTKCGGRRGTGEVVKMAVGAHPAGSQSQPCFSQAAGMQSNSISAARDTLYDSKRFDAALTLARTVQDGRLSVDMLDEHTLACIVKLAGQPWDLDALLWDMYVCSTNRANLAVAERIFSYLIEHDLDAQTQAYARNHLGRVLYQQGRLREALAMYMSVTLQPDGRDFWYVDARDEAGSIACKLLDHAGDEQAFEEYYATALKAYTDALAVADVPSVRAFLHYCRADILANKEPEKAAAEFAEAARLFEQQGNRAMHENCETRIKDCHLHIHNKEAK